MGMLGPSFGEENEVLAGSMMGNCQVMIILLGMKEGVGGGGVNSVLSFFLEPSPTSVQSFKPGAPGRGRNFAFATPDSVGLASPHLQE